MKGKMRLHGSVRVSAFILEIDLSCTGFDEVEKVLTWIESMRFRHPLINEADS